MTPPRTIKVGPFRYDLRIVADDGSMADVEGAISHTAGLLFVRGDLSPSRMQETVFHELIHAAIDTTNLRGKSKEKEERIVSALSPVLLQILRENPKLLAYLLEK